MQNFFDYNLLHLQAKGTEAVKYEMRILENAGRSAWSAAFLADSLEEVREKEAKLREIEQRAKKEKWELEAEAARKIREARIKSLRDL